ncbi:MAG: hypothetical protein Q4C12_00175 [Clostridia bacterium]|nr:hypothetical protein [Clostridia bacterium]
MIDFITYAASVTKATKNAKNYTDSVISMLPNGIVYKGGVSYFSSLPSNPDIGDAYIIKYTGSEGTNPDGREYVWGEYDGTPQWILISGVSDIIDSSGESIVSNGIAVIPDAMTTLPSELFGKTFNTAESLIAAANSAFSAGHIKMSNVYRGGINTNTMLLKNNGDYFVGNIELWLSVVPNTSNSAVYIFEAISVTDAPYLWQCYACADGRNTDWIVSPTRAELKLHTDSNVTSEEGAHNLRYHNNTLEYFDGTDWVALSIANLFI